MAKITDNNTLNVNIGISSKDDIYEILNRFVEQASKILKRNINCFFRVNIPNKQGEPMTFAYIRISNSEIYHLLLGRNPDGSERFNLVDDLNWVPPTIVDTGKKKRWGDEMDEEDLLTRPKIKVPLEPLVPIPKLKYPKSRRDELLNEQFKRKKLKDSDVKIEDIVIPEYVEFDPHPAYIKDDIFHTLRCYSVPEPITEIDLFDHLQIYNTKPGLNYPLVKIKYETNKNGTKNRNAYITFDSGTHDAQFALLMVLKYKLVRKADKAKIVYDLTFGPVYPRKD